MRNVVIGRIVAIAFIVGFAGVAQADYWDTQEITIETDFVEQLFYPTDDKEADISVNPTRGEGFGLIPLEHMATGLPVLVSNNSGCKEYVNDYYNIPIRCNLGQAYFGPEYGLDEIPDYTDMKDEIQRAYEHRADIKKLGKQASEWVHREWNWDKATDKLLEVIQNAGK